MFCIGLKQQKAKAHVRQGNEEKAAHHRQLRSLRYPDPAHRDVNTTGARDGGDDETEAKALGDGANNLNESQRLQERLLVGAEIDFNKG